MPCEDKTLIFFSFSSHKSLVAESDALRLSANALFASGDAAAALARYTDALTICPSYLTAPRAVLHTNAAACHLRLEAWSDAITAATAALDADPSPAIRLKSLLRRAAAHEALGGWQHLEAALDDYRALDAKKSLLRSSDGEIVARRLVELPERVRTARELEVGEMWGKLKEVRE